MEKKYLFFDIDGTLTDRATRDCSKRKRSVTAIRRERAFCGNRNWKGTLQGRKLYIGYGWCLVMDDTKDVYMKDTLFRKIS